MKRFKIAFCLFISLAVIISIFPSNMLFTQAALTSGDYEFSLTSEGRAVITGYSGAETEIAIPAILESNGNKYEVASVDMSIYDKTNVADISIPSTVTVLENISDLNRNHNTLKRITVDGNNESFSSQDGALFNKDKTILYLFPNASSKAIYTIADTVEAISVYAFAGNPNLSIVTFGDGVKEIGTGAFSDCTRIGTISLNDKLESIATNAFNGCSNLIFMSIPASVNNIGLAVFRNCSRLVSITVDDENTDYTDDAGVLFRISDNGVKTELIAYPAAKTDKSYTIPDKVIAVVSYAFHAAKNLQSIDMGTELLDIRSYAFADCAALSSVKIGSGVSNIGECAFLNCSSLESIRIGNNVNSIGNHALGYYYVEDTQEYKLYENFTIYTPANTAAYQYAYNNNINLVADGECSHIYAAVYDIVTPTCTQEGYTEYVCTYCGERFKRAFVEPRGHKDSEWIIDKEATYTSTGARHKVCDVCGVTTVTETIPMLKNGMDDCLITLSETTVIETGDEIMPEVTVKFKGRTLKEGVDYTLSYSSNVKPGIAKIVVTGIGSGFSDSRTVTFEIKPKGVSDIDVESTQGTSVKLKWEAQDNVSGYKIYMYDDNTDDYELVKTLRGADNTSATISKTPDRETLKTGTFDFRIYAYTIVDSQTTVLGDAIDVTIVK